MKRSTRKNLISLACTLSLVAIGGGVALKADNAKADELNLTGSSMVASEAQLRVKTSDDDQTGNGLRFVVETATTTLPEGATKTGTLVVPTALLVGELTVETDHVYDFDTTADWNVYEDSACSYAYFWNMSEYSYNLELAYRGYVVIAGDVYYTNVETTSLAEVALDAVQHGDTSAEEYLLDYTVTYDVEGDEDPTESVKYGDKVQNVPEAPAAKDGYTFDGWYVGDKKFDVENDVVKGNITLTPKYVDNESINVSSYRLDGRPLDAYVNTDKANTYNSDASIKIVTGASSYGDSSGVISNVAFNDAEPGDYISYWIKVGEATRATTKGGAQQTTTLKVTELVNPQAFGATSLGIKTTDGNFYLGETVETGVWYQVLYQLTGKSNDEDNTSFKRIPTKSGKLAWMRSGSNSNFINATYYVDGIVLGTSEDFGLADIDQNLLTTWSNQYGGNGTPQIVAGEDLPAGCQSDAAIKLNVHPSADSSYQIKLYNHKFGKNIEEGLIFTYRIYVTNITTNLYANRNNWENGKQTATSVRLDRLVDYGAPNSHTATIEGNPSAIQQNTWYTVSNTITTSITDGALEFGTFLAAWQSKTERHYAYTIYIDLISIKQPDKVDNESFTERAANPYPNNDLCFITVNEDPTYIYPNSGSTASLALGVSASEYCTTSVYPKNGTWTMKAGDTVTYYVRIENLEKSTKADRSAWANASPLSTLHTSALLSPNDLSSQGVNANAGCVKDLDGNDVTSMQVGEWYVFTYTVKADVVDGKITFNARHHGALGGWDSNIALRYTLYIDCMTVTKA